MALPGPEVLLEGRNLCRLMEGLCVTMEVSLLSVALSLPLGIALGVIMTSPRPAVRLLTRIYLDFIRIMPQLVLLFLAYFGLSRALGINLSAFASAVLVFTLWGMAEMGDLVRGAILSLPRHQVESARVLGLSTRHIYLLIVIPQILRRLVPPSINLVTRMIKTTSLVVIIGMVEVLKVGQQIIDASRFTHPGAALWVYGAIFVLYFAACWPIARWAAYLERRWSLEPLRS